MPQQKATCFASLLRLSFPTAATSPEAVTPEIFRARREAFEKLMVFLPPEAREPSADLVEVINWYEEGGGD
jgi:hypothetical protein